MARFNFNNNWGAYSNIPSKYDINRNLNNDFMSYSKLLADSMGSLEEDAKKNKMEKDRQELRRKLQMHENSTASNKKLGEDLKSAQDELSANEAKFNEWKQNNPYNSEELKRVEDEFLGESRKKVDDIQRDIDANNNFTISDDDYRLGMMDLKNKYNDSSFFDRYAMNQAEAQRAEDIKFRDAQLANDKANKEAEANKAMKAEGERLDELTASTSDALASINAGKITDGTILAKELQSAKANIRELKRNGRDTQELELIVANLEKASAQAKGQATANARNARAKAEQKKAEDNAKSQRKKSFLKG